MPPTSAEMAKELGPFKDYKRNAKHMLRVIRNHRTAAHGLAQGYEGLSITPVPLDHANLKDAALSERARVAWDNALALARSTATAMPRSRSSRPPARSASSWTATPPASSPTLRW